MDYNDDAWLSEALDNYEAYLSMEADKDFGQRGGAIVHDPFESKDRQTNPDCRDLGRKKDWKILCRWIPGGGQPRLRILWLSLAWMSRMQQSGHCSSSAGCRNEIFTSRNRRTAGLPSEPWM